MSFLYVLSWIALALQMCFATVSLAAGLYYVAELVEEYSQAARRVIIWMIGTTSIVYILFIFFDNLPWSMIAFGICAQAFHLAIMQTFPFIRFQSFAFIGALLLLIINHYYAFDFFTTNYYTFLEVLAYFTVCLWMVPFALFVSLSANDNVLPTINDYNNRDDVVTNYFGAHGKKQGLLAFFNYAKDTLLPGRSKKTF